MNNACKRLLSLFMAVAMVMSYVAVPVSAEDGDPQPPASCLGQAGVECTFDAHIEGCDKYEAPVTSCQGLAGVECTFDAHIEGCDKYEAPVTSCQGLAGVECTFDAHIEGCDKYAVPVTSCQGLAGVECAFDAHIEGCDKYVAPVTSCLGQAGVECAFDAHIEGCDKYEAPVTSCQGLAGVECTFDAHIEGCDKYEAPVTCNGTADCEAEAHNDGCAKAAADAAAKQVEEVEALIEALPTEEEVRAMDWNQLTALNTQITNISLKIDALGDHKSAVDTTGIAALAALLNERVMTLTETAVAKIGDTPYKTLAFAIEAAVANDTIILQDHIALAEGVTIPAGKNITIDLNGKTISRNTTVAATSAAITNNGTLTIKDSLTGGKITAFAANPDTAAIPYYASNTITNCGVLTVKSGTIENSTSDAARAAFPIDNNSTSRDAIVNIEGGTITGRGAIRQFANSTSHKNEVNITGGTVTGTSYGVWVQNPGSGDPVAALNISGEANVAKVLLDPSSNFDVAITGGTVSGVAIWSADTSNPSRNPAGFITGGNFRTDVSAFVALGYEYADGSVTQSTTVKVDTEEKLAQAFAIADGRTITLLDDIELSETITVTGTVTLDLGSYTITGTPATAAAFAVIHNKGNLTITGSGAIVCDHKLEGSTDYAVNTILNDGTLTINGPTIENKSTASNQIGYAIDNYAGSSATILSGEVKASGSNYYDGIRLFCSDSSGISVTVKGGKVSTIWMQNPSGENIKDVKGSITISDEGEVGKLYLEPSAVFTASITGGTVGSVSYNETAAGRNLTGFITGGNFGTDVSAFVALGYEYADGRVTQSTTIKVDTEDELTQAFAIADGRTITLLDDIELSETLVIPAGKTVTLDLNGFSITGDTDAAAASSITVNGTLDVYDSQHTDTSAIKVPITVSANGGQFALNKPAAVGALNSSGMAYIYGGTVNGTISTQSAGLVEIWGGNILGEMVGQVCVKGEPNGKLNEAVFANDPTEFCEDGFYGEKRTDGKYTIAEHDHMIVNGLVKYDTNLGNVIDTTDGGADSLLDIVLKKGDATITGEHAVKNGLDLLLDTEENKVTGGGSVTSEQVMQIVSNEADTVLPDGGKITFHSDAITYAPRRLDQEGYGRIDFSDHNGRKCYYLDKGATLTVTHKGEVSVTGKYILGNARGPIYTISISQDGPYDNRHYLGKDGDMTVTCNGFYGSVEKIWITGEKLDGKVHVVFEKGAALSGFEVEEGSTVVTLSKKYLNSLEKGDYKIHFQYKDHDDGEYVSEVFKVRTKSSYETDPTNPKTGDTILLPMAVMLTSAAALFVLVMNKKKHA